MFRLPAKFVGPALAEGRFTQTELSRSEPIVNQLSVNSKKILITTESHEIFVLRTDRRDRAFGRCPSCDCEVEILTLDQAISLSGIRTRELIRLAEANEVHAIETATGHLLICNRSIDGNGKGINTAKENTEDEIGVIHEART